MSQLAGRQSARRKSNPSLAGVSGSGPNERPPGAQQPHDAEAPWVEPDADADCVICFLSGRRVLRKEAVQVRLGPGRTMWMSQRLISEADKRR